MESSIFLPKKIKVGFQKRDDTYTKKLAYIIYYDEKSKLRKETSWNSWRDDSIDSLEFDNIPTEGFVLNKKAGGGRSHWNARKTYIRVYDPRDFEFEISVPNLLYILENTNSIKGKGLEGEFVYGWSGKELVLIPISSPDFVEMSKLNDLRHSKNKIPAKDLKLGATYRHKSNTKMVYMGRFELYEDTRWDEKNSIIKKGKHYYFMVLNVSELNPMEVIKRLVTFKTMGDNFIEVVDNTCIENYAEIFEDIEKDPKYSPIDPDKTVYIKYSLEEIIHALEHSWQIGIYIFLNGQYIGIQINKIAGQYSCYSYFLKNTPPYRKGYKTVDELYSGLKPYYRRRYLANGNLFDSSNNR